MKTAFVAFTFIFSSALPAQAQVRCRVKMDGKTARRVQPPVQGALAFSLDDVNVVAQSVPGKANRVQFTFLNNAGRTKAFVVAAFRKDGKLRANPEINGQQMSLLCLRK